MYNWIGVEGEKAAPKLVQTNTHAIVVIRSNSMGKMEYESTPPREWNIWYICCVKTQISSAKCVYEMAIARA